jgi:hypothetical protein
MAERGENPLALFFRMLGYSIAQQAKQPQGASDADLLLAMLDQDPKTRALKLKRLFASQFAVTGGRLPVFDGPGGSSLVTERNRVALETLDEQVAAGKQKLAIFYGAGHMADFERQLTERYGLKAGEDRWLVAWDLDAKDPEAGDE